MTCPHDWSACLCLELSGRWVWVPRRSRGVAAGGVAVERIPLARWDYEAIEASAHAARYGGFICATRFDSTRFALSAAEASVMDPQQRLVLELASDALGTVVGDESVFVGIQANDFAEITQQQRRMRESVYAITSTNHAVACGRVAYLLGLRGAAVSVNTACSSALVAMHAARGELAPEAVAVVGLEPCIPRALIKRARAPYQPFLRNEQTDLS